MIPKVSIIIPVYNSERFLAYCLDSCLAQAPFVIGVDYEIICINDGSTDGSANILQEYGEKGIRVLTQRNSGVSAARNKGIDEAKGEFLWFVDSDDLIRPNILQQVYYHLKQTCSDGCSLKCKIVDENYKFDSLSECVTLSFDENIASMPNACLVIVKSDYINKYNIRFNVNMSYGEDTFFIYWLRLYRHKFINTPDVLYFYRQVKTSAMHQKTLISLEKSLSASLIRLKAFKQVLDNWDANLYAGDAMTEERYYWCIQNILFTILRIDKKRRDEYFKRLQQEGHYPYPIQIKRLLVDSNGIKGYLINAFCLFFPIKLYYNLVSRIFGK